MSRRQIVSALLLLWLPALIWASWVPPAAADDPEARPTKCVCEDDRPLTYQANPDGSVYGGYLLWVQALMGSDHEWCYRECVQACGCDVNDPDLTCSKECVIGPDVLGTAGPAGTPTASPPTPAMPCPEPGFFYPGINLNGYFTGAPPLAADRADLVAQLGKALQDYADEGNKVTEGVAVDDVYQVAMTLRNDHAQMPTGKETDLKQAVRDLARKRQQADPGYRVSPGELFYLSLKANRGNVRDALLSCHAVLFRDKAEVNKKFIEQEGILAPLRNPDGYVDGPWTYTTHAGTSRTNNPRRDLGQEEQGVWYHLFGMAALEYTDDYGAAGYEAAYYAASKGWLGLDPNVTKRGFPISGMGGKLGDLAVALEDGIRSNQGKPPDIVKHCFNYTGLAVGAELKRLTTRTKARRNSFANPGGVSTGDILRPNGTVNYRSPLSLRIEGAAGEWFTFDQDSGAIDGNTAAI